MASFEAQKKIFEKVAPLAMEEAERLLSDGPFRMERGDVLGRDVLRFSHSPAYLGAFFADVFDRASPSDEFLVFEDERISYKEAEEKVLRLRWALRNQFRLQKGERVAIAMPNYPEWILSFIAVTWEGGVAVALNGWWKDKELHYGFVDSQSRILICDTKIFKRGAYSLAQKGEKKSSLETVLVAKTSKDNGEFERMLQSPEISEFLKTGKILKFEDCLDSVPSLVKQTDTCGLDRDDMAAIFYTSGTTGFPKGVVLTHRGICDQTHFARFGKLITNWTEQLGKSIAFRSAPPPLPSTLLPKSSSLPSSPLPYSQKSDGVEKVCMAVPIPLFHVTGCHHIFLGTMAGWGKLVLMPKWSASKALKLIEKEKITDWTGVPTLITDLLECLRLHPHVDLSSLKKVGGGGAQFTPALVERTKGTKLPYNPSQGYGLTETNGAIAAVSGISFLLTPDTTGPLFPICEGAIVDPETLERKAVDQEGELLVKSSLIMKGYFNKKEATEKAIISLAHPKTGKSDPGWFRTGDLARMNKDGLVFIVGRKKELVIRGGENISCNEVEAAVAAHWGVAECTVFPLPDPRLGERVATAIHPRAGCFLTPQMITEFLKENHLLASYKIPTDIFFSGSVLPRTASGKIAKRLVSQSILQIENERKSQQPKL